MDIVKAMAVSSLLASLSAYAVSGEAGKASDCDAGTCSAVKQSVSKDGVVLVTSGDMKRIVDAKDSIILDARTGVNDDGQRIPGAKSLSPSASEEEVSKRVPNKASSIVTYCANLKCPASAALANRLRSLGYRDVKEYPEGIQGWISTGNPVENAVK